MRPALIAVIATGLIAFAHTPSRAETSAPVCLHVYGPITYDDCRYASIEQCRPSASGRPAACIVNPFYGGASEAAAAPRRRARPDRY